MGIKPTPNSQKFYDPNLVSYYDRQYRDLSTGQAIVQNGQLDSYEKNFLTSRGITLDKTPLTDPRYEGGYDAVRRFAKSWSQNQGAVTAEAYVPLYYAPGEAYQFDWSHEIVVISGVTVTVKVAVVVFPLRSLAV